MEDAQAALDAGADSLLLDNQSVEQLSALVSEDPVTLEPVAPVADPVAPSD